MSKEVLCRVRSRDNSKPGPFFPFTDTEYDCEYKDGKVIVPEGIKVVSGFFADESFAEVETIQFPESLESIELLPFFGNERYNNSSIDINVKNIEMLGDERNVKMYHSIFKEFKKLYHNGMLIIGRVLVDCERSFEDIVVPDGIEVISDSCFGEVMGHNLSLRNVSLPGSLKTIKSNAFRNCDKLVSVAFRDEPIIESIGDGAFAFCPNLVGFTIPSSAKEIGCNAFKKTPVTVDDLTGTNYIGEDALYGTKDVASSSFSETLINQHGGIHDFKKHIGVADENGVLTRNGSIIYAYQDSSRVEIPDEVTTVDEQFEILGGDTDNNRITLVMPKSLKEIVGADTLMKDNVTVELPDTYLRQKKAVSTEIVFKYLTSTAENDLILEDYVSLFLLQGAKKISQICEPYLEKDCNKTVDCMMEVLRDRGTQKGFNTAKTFIIENQKNLSSERVKSFYILCEKNKKAKITEELDRVFGGVKSQSSEKDPIEEKCRAMYKESFVDDTLKKATISTNKAFKKAPVLYKETGEAVPEFVVRSALALYMKPILNGNIPEIQQSAEELIAAFDRDSFCAFLMIVGDRVIKKFKEDDYHFAIYGVQTFDYMIPLMARFLDDSFIDACIEQYHINEQCEWDYSNQKTNLDDYNDLLIDGIIMSDSETAKEFCKSIGAIDRYAQIRGMSASEMSGNQGGNTINREADLRITKAIALFDECIKKLDKLMDNDYNEPTVLECYGIGPINKENEQAGAFFEKLYCRYSDPESVTMNYDYAYEPKVLYDLWKNNAYVSEGQIGLCFTVGIAVAYYMFESSDIDAEIVYCRDKWEYRGDYSKATRASLHITQDVGNWMVYEKKGYSEYDM